METNAHLNLLLVEDYALDADALARKLMSAGWFVHATRAPTRDALVIALAHGDYDIALLDCRTPEFTCEDALRTIRGVQANLPVVVMSYYLDGYRVTRLMELGAQDYIDRHDSARLLQTIRREVEMYRILKRIERVAQAWASSISS